MKADFTQILNELGKDLELPFFLQNDGICTIKVEDKLLVQIKIHEDEENILISSFLTSLPAGKFRENIFVNTLKANNEIPKTGIFAFNEPSSELILFERISLYFLEFQKFKTLLTEFIQKAMSWKESLENQQTAPADFLKDKKSNSPFWIKK